MQMPATMTDGAGSTAKMPESLEALFTACEAPLLRYAHRLVQDIEVSQEIVQESFMRLHAQFNQVERPRPWLYRTVHNLALNHRRANQKIVPLEFEEGAAGAVDDQPMPGERIERLEAIEQTRLCLESLAKRERELVQMKFEQGLSYKEMSEKTGLSVSNVGYILHHALKAMALRLQEKGVQL